MSALAWIAFAVAQLADVLSTRRFLDLGIREANPIWRWAQSRMGRWWWLPRLALAWAVAGGLQWWAGSALPVTVIAVGIAGAAVWNWRQVERRR